MAPVPSRWADWSAALFDPRKVPFSRRGSFLAVSYLAGDTAFWIRNLRGGDAGTDLGRMTRITVVDKDGAAVDPTVAIAPDEMSFQDAGGRLAFAFDGPARIVLTGEGLGLKLETGPGKYNYGQASDDVIDLCVARQDLRCRMVVKRGRAHLATTWNGVTADHIAVTLMPRDGALDASLDFFRAAPSAEAAAGFAEARHASALDFQAFLDRQPRLPEAFAAARLLAAYILWSGYVPAEGALRRPSIYMSKNGMTNIWSWDHCFVALALGASGPAAAFEQMAAVFDAQHETGRLPDFINDRYAYWSFTKPPVHGWAFATLRRMAPGFYDTARLPIVLRWLEAQADDWMNSPMLEGLPCYRHGNDAGWDNATFFLEGGPVATPDLATFLILQFQEIARLHRALANAAEAEKAEKRASALIDSLCRSLWRQDRFVARLQRDGKSVSSGDPLLGFMPLLLGRRLPEDMRARLLHRLFAPGRFLTGHGFASEALDSPHYCADGYWRGPIWAPATALLVDALDRCGEAAKADDVVRRFCRMAAASGMAENFDAESGAGLCDPAFAWTSAVFLTLGGRFGAATV